jgi:protein CpxP
MRKIGRAAVAAGCVVLGTALVAAAGQTGTATSTERPRNWQGRRGTALAEYLGLDAQQKTAWRQLQQQHRDEMKPLRDEGRDLRQKLRVAVNAEKPDAQAVGEATLALKAHREKMKASRAAFEQKLAALLTPEQKQKLDALQAARQFGRRGKRGRWGGAMGPRPQL